MTDPLRLYAAGSLRLAFAPLLATFSERYAVDVIPTFGPAGLLSEKMMHGDAVDIFASANCAHPLRLKALGLAEETTVFTRNHLCIVMRNVPELTTQSWLMALLDPRFVLSTSTPGSDPGGDYAFELFDRIERLHRGWGNQLRDKAKPLVGGALDHAIPAGMTAGSYLIRTGKSDMHIGYASYLPLLLNQPDLHVVQLPDPYRIDAEYMLAVMKPARREARLLANYLLSPEGQGFLVNKGFASRFSLQNGR
ncbi:molybdate ABC transporter substrate-binding protein [Pectobacterium brasiliense]|uniref:Molybdate ABC transporter substrate-binding protein n=1 Tax=Pectobacterium brasiliense TaxID=180957 RepID=A0AAE3BFB9_9GAMM|nr:molybdate ABC transporter substrate-binding protein [Pectobacterium brasiliense]MBA0216988.1 molybdate ABC transporter substrate-binding protein [Pectobacterium brasiliense]MBN3052268.1 molybdate ABC transporter substrate-binding protein [Pectobacterium brasiliense]MBN3072378.1 molybdate ABC transporter substrate-binding protein [Pectobacterium brasiliense]MBN3167960.1 molybdate ABC transporter substrate-binding protein [Pectobacterium brasiliense]